jgi:hypothetical protein
MIRLTAGYVGVLYSEGIAATSRGSTIPFDTLGVSQFALWDTTYRGR